MTCRKTDGMVFGATESGKPLHPPIIQTQDNVMMEADITRVRLLFMDKHPSELAASARNNAA
jgi:hypothetical protein